MESLIAKVDGWGIALTRRVAFGGVIAMLIIATGSIADVILRAVADSPIAGLNEITEVFFAVAIAACFPAGLTQRIHITVDLLANRYGSQVTAWLKFAGSVMLFWMFTLLAWRLADIAAELTEARDISTILEIPVWPFIWAVAGIVALGAIFQFFVIGVEATRALRTGEAEAGRQSIDTALTFVMLAAVFATLGVIWGFDDGVALLADAAKASPAAVAFIIFGLVWALLLLILPVAASTACSRSPDVNRMRGGEPPSPGQYATPRRDGVPPATGRCHSSSPVTGSSATTRSAAGMYMTPSTTMGVACERGPPPPGSGSPAASSE